ncbi:MAG: VWA domain-containing protein [Acidobacteriota bacterium]
MSSSPRLPMWTKRFLAAAIAAVTALPAGAQAPAGTFGETLEVRVVNIEVVVVDRAGNRVTGLGPQDFKLLVDGKPVPIEYFTEVRGGGAVAASAAPGTGLAPTQGVPALAPGGAVGTSYLVFIDDLFSITRDRDRVLESLRRDVAQLGPEDRMAIVAYNGRRLEMLSSWSQSVAVLDRALRKASERPAFGLQRLAELRINDRDRQMRRQTVSFGVGGAIGGRDIVSQLDLSERAYASQLAEQVQGSVAAAAATLRSFAQPPGRKVMLLLSGGWPYIPVEYTVNDFARPVSDTSIPGGEPLFRPLADTANLLGYTIYPVDVPGLQGQSIAMDESSAEDAQAATLEARSREQENEYSLLFVAKETGGEALLNGLREKALSEAEADTRSYYWLGFTPARRGDDKRSQIRVEVNRPGLKVRSRDSFLDLSKKHEVSMEVESALLFGNPPSMRSLTVAVGKPQKASMGTVKLPLEISIPLDSITMVPIEGRYVADLELRVAALDEAGRRSEVPVLPFQITGHRAPFPGQQVKYETTLELRRSRQQIVVAVYDKASGNLLSSTLEVAP